MAQVVVMYLDCLCSIAKRVAMIDCKLSTPNLIVVQTYQQSIIIVNFMGNVSTCFTGKSGSANNTSNPQRTTAINTNNNLVPNSNITSLKTIPPITVPPPTTTQTNMRQPPISSISSISSNINPLNLASSRVNDRYPQISSLQNSQNSSRIINQSPPSLINPPTTSTQKISIIIRTINSLEKEVTLPKKMTGKELKQYIYAHLCQSLSVNEMSLYYEGVKIAHRTLLSSLHIVVGNKIKIVQQKIDITDVVNIVAEAHRLDPISGEQGAAQMKCGHFIGRDTMTAFVRSLITSHKYQIRCPYPDDNDLLCNSLWNFNQCRKIGVFTQQQLQEFSQGLSRNWIKEFSKKCPNPSCGIEICKKDLKSDRVVCPKCKFGDFCYKCLNKWKSDNSQICGNQECKFLVDFVTNSPWNRKFELYDKANNNTLKVYVTPQYRACPNCLNIIEHSKACKHMRCNSCQTPFCWVCLGTTKNGKWDCGAYNQYCGKVAQAQNLQVK